MENPYQPPAYVPPVVTGLKKNSPENLQKVAFCQRGVMLCLAVYLLATVAAPLIAVVDTGTSLFLWRGSLVTLVLVDVLVGTLFVFRLSTLVYGFAAGLVMGLLTLIPCFGLFLLVLTNGIATATLRRNGIRVGFLGASLRQFSAGPLDESQ